MGSLCPFLLLSMSAQRTRPETTGTRNYRMILQHMDTTTVLDGNNTAPQNNATINVDHIQENIRRRSSDASDIFNILGRPKASGEDTEKTSMQCMDISSLIFYFGIISNIVFMVCVAQERYLLVTCPQCNAFCVKLKQLSMILLAVWLVPFAILFLAYRGYVILFSVALLLPLPFLVFIFLDSFRALWSNKNNILGMQAVILSTITVLYYSMLYLAFILHKLLKALSLNSYVYYLGLVSDLLYLGPLVDPFLSIFLTNGVILKAFPYCVRTNTREETFYVNTDTVKTASGILGSEKKF